MDFHTHRLEVKKAVERVCAPNENILQNVAFEASEKIREKTIYKFVDVIVQTPKGSNHGLVTGVIVEDHGNRYEVKPNSNGLRFAVGEISFREYKQLERKEFRLLFSIFFGGILTFLVIMGIISRLL
ncbi:hypothetical protein [Bacillus pinisoli]|uniref:hypothetical protein n=1 Tax=Bacillus pinisoli TaxID=2901866 RepID=UPI001FF5B12F|nr:hypothetical protein [Bacillus pinisoli]